MPIEDQAHCKDNADFAPRKAHRVSLILRVSPKELIIAMEVEASQVLNSHFYTVLRAALIAGFPRARYKAGGVLHPARVKKAAGTWHDIYANTASVPFMYLAATTSFINSYRYLGVLLDKGLRAGISIDNAAPAQVTLPEAPTPPD